MKITDIRVYPVDEEKLKAFVTIVFDECFVVSDIKIIHGTHGLFISMPSKRKRNGEFKDVAHPLNSRTRQMIEETILAHYEEVLAEGPVPRRPRSPREALPLDEQSRSPGVEQSATKSEDVASDGRPPEIPGI